MHPRHSNPLFASAIFLASFLLFLIEPIAAKQLVPAFGGSAAVWITCLVFFQTALLAGYLYAHWLTHRAPQRYSSLLHIALLVLAIVAACVWSVTTVPLAGAGTHPVTTIFRTLAISIGLPFFLLASTSPLLQLWYARLSQSKVPYRFFALSNLASLLALALYPTLVEPHLTLQHQRMLWCIGFIAFVAVSGTLALRARSAAGIPLTAADDATLNDAAQLPLTRLLWLLLPMGAAMQLSAVTSHLSQNIAAIPLLWILPLAAYLLSLILAFEFPRLLPRGILIRFLAVMLASLGYLLSKVDVTVPISISIPIYLAELFIACLFCHSEAFALRPARASQSTVFYLMIAAGGALGSFLIGIASPLVFSSNYDLAISFIITALLALAVTWNDGWAQRLLWSTASILLFFLLYVVHGVYQHNTLLSTRNFYGTLRVTQAFSGHDYPVRTLANGTIEHGTQLYSASLMHTPTTYYAQDSGIGLALRFCCADKPRKIGVVGLGAGTIAAYGRTGDHIRFYEINPSVLPIAQNLFTYLRDSPAQISFAQGDARFSLASEAPQNFDVLAVDAFSGDAIPLHLLTSGAMAIYRKHLAQGGILAFHVSNQHVDLEPEIHLLAQSAGMQTKTVSTGSDDRRGEFRATWVLVTNNAAFFTQPEVVPMATPTEQRPGIRLWADDYSSLLPLMRW